MSAKLHGKAHRYLLIPYARSIGIDASDNLLRASKHLLLALAEHYNDTNGQCNPSIKTLSTLIERTHGPTVKCMNLLKQLGIVSVKKNAKGGRETPHYDLHFPKYDEFSHISGRSVSHPVERMVENYPNNAYAPVEVIKPSSKQNPTPHPERIRTLIEPSDEPLIKSLVNMKNTEEKQLLMQKLASRNKIHIGPSDGMWQLEEKLKQLLKK